MTRLSAWRLPLLVAGVVALLSLRATAARAVQATLTDDTFTKVGSNGLNGGQAHLAGVV